jgi:glycogen debranching enzyme
LPVSQHLPPDPSTNSLIEVDPHHGQQLVSEGYTVLISNADGSITGERQGLFDFDTRLLCAYELLVDEQRPHLVSAGLLSGVEWLARLTLPRPGGSAAGPELPQDVFEIAIRRRIGCGMSEQIEVFNHSMEAASCVLAIRCDADFADVAELCGERQQQGRRRRAWNAGNGTLTFDYRASRADRHLHRALRVRVLRTDSAPQVTRHGLIFQLALPPRGAWRVALAYETLVDDKWRTPTTEENRDPTAPAVILRGRQSVIDRWHESRAHVDSDPPLFARAIERAANDLIGLRNWEYDSGPDAWIPNAGLPSYTGLFGRDTLTAGWQSGLISSELARGALASLAATQADRDSPWHDEEPGKMVHEVRRGPLSELHVIPQRGYYGTETSSSFFVIALSELWHWTGDLDLLRRYRDAALRTFAWAEEYGDRDRDGFLEYETRSSRGLRNHGWKDSDEAIRHADGRLTPTPISTVEEQAYHWLALQRMAEMLLVLGDDAGSVDFLSRARRLREKFQAAFWMDDARFYAMALDGEKQQVQSIGSNAGHVLSAGLVPIEHARGVADRLLAADMFSGWGIRTLSADHPSYSPLAYHLGAVWPVENATIALGFKRYGLDAHVEQLVTAMFGMAAGFRDCRLPEALSGHSRVDAPIPTIYPASCSPQAWSASAAIQMAQAALGIYAFAPANVLAIVRPRLPRWLRSVTVRGVRVGSASVSIHFERRADGTTMYDVLEKSGTLHVLGVPPPQDVDRRQQDWRDHLSTWLLEHAPGRTAAALRIAMGIEDALT